MPATPCCAFSRSNDSPDDHLSPGDRHRAPRLRILAASRRSVPCPGVTHVTHVAAVPDTLSSVLPYRDCLRLTSASAAVVAHAHSDAFVVSPSAGVVSGTSVQQSAPTATQPIAPASRQQNDEEGARRISASPSPVRLDHGQPG